jgi:superfamily I DNA/RNA helicase
MDKFLSLFSKNENKNFFQEDSKKLDKIIKTLDDDKKKYSKQIHYNKEQLEFITYPIQNCKLLGIPGGGKTQSIIGKIVYHYSRNELTKNNEFLILTFSRRACNDFLIKGKKSEKKIFNTKNIRTLHSLAGKIVFKILGKRSSSQDTVIISAIDLLEHHKNELLEIPQFSDLKVIFVDEAQDISAIQYDLIMKISGLIRCCVIMIGDPNQNIYQFQKGSDYFLINHPGHNFSLIQNYRSTPEIVNFVNNFRPWDLLTPKMVSTKKSVGKLPIIFTGTIEEIIEDITNKILKSTFPREEIAIIGPVKKSKPINDVYTNIGLSLFTNLLNKYNINYIKHYEDTNNDEMNLSEFKKIEGHINLFTVHGSKGLEFDQVFLLNFHTSAFGIMPTEEKYNEFKYLWYVGLSRASYDLNIYIYKNKLPWNELKYVSCNIYNTENSKPVFLKELKFQEEIVPMYFTVTELLNSKKYLDDELFYKLEKVFNYEVEKIPIFEIDFYDNLDCTKKRIIKNYKSYSALYGIFIENIFNFFYNIKYGILADFITKLKKIINNTIIIPKKYIYGYKILKMRCPFIAKDLVRLGDFTIIKNQFRKAEEELYAYLCELLKNDYSSEFFIDCENDVINYSKSELLEYISYFENGVQEKWNLEKYILDENIKKLFKLTLCYYQRSNECAYLWETDFSEELLDLDFYIKHIIKYAYENVTDEYIFHKSVEHSKLPIVGELDMINKNRIVDIKFSNNLNIKHILQVLLYYHIVSPNFSANVSIELWNFLLGYKYIIKIDVEKINVYGLLKILSKGIGQKMKDMIFFYDLETTGFRSEYNKMDIIERYFEEYTTCIIPSSGLIKLVDVPYLPFEITSLTGITQNMLYENGDHIEKFKREIDELLSYCNNPIFIAHNGNSFDHKILLERGIFEREKCKFLDSRMIIRLFLKNEVGEKSLSDIFKYLFKFNLVAHRAAADVKMMIAIFRKLEIDDDKILAMV